MSDNIREMIIELIYILIICLGFVSYFLHKRRIKKYEEKLENERTERGYAIISSLNAPKPLDEKTEYILCACYVALTIVTSLLSNKYSIIGISLLLFCCAALNYVTEKRAQKQGYAKGYDNGYIDSYYETQHNTILSTTKKIVSSFDTVTPESKITVCNIINEVKNFEKLNKSEIKLLLKSADLKYSDFYKYLKDNNYFYIHNEG